MTSRSARVGLALLLLACGFATRSAAAPADSAGVADARWPAPEVRAWQTGLARPDRLQHGSLALCLALGIGAATRQPWSALGTTLALGVTKELWDARAGGSGFDGLDLTADALGAGLGALGARALER